MSTSAQASPPRRESVVFIGPRCAGKSTLAPRLAAELGWSTADTDEMIATEVGRPAAEFLRTAGEVRFRDVEERVVLGALASNARRVLALGGGAVISAETRRELARAVHFVVLVTAPVAVLVERALGGPDRPPLTGLSPADEVAQLLAERGPLYRSVSDLEVDTFSANVTACLRSILASMGHSAG